MIYNFDNSDELADNIRLHILYCLIYGLSIIAGLWQHGHPIYTCFLIVMVFLVMLLPFFRIFRNQLTRSIVQIMFPLLAGVWLFYRFISRVPSDKFLVESLALAGFAFSFTLCKKDRSYFLLISSILLIYGAVYPRALFIYLIPLIMVMILVTFYLSRADALCQAIDIPASRTGPSLSWVYIIPHAALLILIAIVIFLLLPTENYTSSGYFNSDFSKHTNYSPPMLRDWFKTQQYQSSNTGNTVIPSGEPSAISKHSSTLVSAPGEEATFTPNGSGTGIPGNDLLFTVKSNEKLYWLVNLYDEYDGTKWKITDKMIKHRLNQNWGDIFKAYFSVQQQFTIKKWYTRALPSAFLPSYFSYYGYKDLKIDKTFFGRKLAVDSYYPELPFTYTVQSYIPRHHIDEPEAPKLLWREAFSKKHYMQLPKDKISFRLRRKANEITLNSHTDFEKAVALRDFLRNSFLYEQFSKKVPEGQEAVDYFVFELKEGHCEYFASAMVTLARLCGLPARVATGFSPGNYNIITKEFEVYEYHAHAWAQVFIENAGWLTFDPTPPGNIISRTTPFGIGALKDPFGDEWQIKPPELSSLVQNQAPLITLNRDELAEFKTNVEKMKGSKLQQLMMNIPTDGEELKDSFHQVSEHFADKKSFLAKCFSSFKGNFVAMINTLSAVCQAVVRFFTGTGGVIFLLLVAAAYPAYLICRRIIRKILKFIKCRQCEEMFDQAVKNLVIAPNICIESCYSATRNLLEISGYGNTHKMELFDYGISLQQIDSQLSKDALAVFYIYTQMSYSLKKAAVPDSEQALSRALNIRSYFRKGE